MKYSLFILLISATALAASWKPNIVFIMSDDQGYGDVSCYAEDAKIKTPAIDSLAAEGMRFTDAHSASSVCTPTRYGVLTGRYPWRTRLQSFVLQTKETKRADGSLKVGTDPLIEKEVLTVPGFLKQHGYNTAMVGKWHLGFQYRLAKGKKIDKNHQLKNAVPVGTKVIDGPIERGFDHFWGFHHAGEMRTWIEQDVVTENFDHPSQMLNRIAETSVQYIKSQTKQVPFFLYVPLNSPHGPTVPSQAWKGKSDINPYADFVMETDDAVGRILQALDEKGMKDNTIVFFTTDNGCSPHANIPQLLKAGHDPSAGLRGTKADIWEGGHRVPYLVRWPENIQAGAVSSEPICHNNLLATCAALLDQPLPVDAGVDSFSILPVLKGEKLSAATHPVIIHASVQGMFAIRQGDWKYIACKNSGGWSRGGDNKPAQLYHMKKAVDEQVNLIDSMPEKAKALRALLEKSVGDGFTVPGKKGRNDVEVVIDKKTKKKRKKQK
ncbi:arylsulfatase [Verrucomicrobiaceae bacterium N1E253]|uniref:Arylsulfatase n=1 Tax=Oceaniferula marina TaxID=2748318 RepID=A0A851GHG8_9BACT|nr:arylsulfatase [Oceaniferula marina]NWK56973.1 arylsulfatase [Oceaniferula marina]